MKNCVNCGAPLDDAAAVCNNCGSGQPQMAPQQPQGGFVQPMAPQMGQPMQPQMGYGQPQQAPQQNQFADQLKDAGSQVTAAVKKVNPKSPHHKKKIFSFFFHLSLFLLFILFLYNIFYVR